MAKIEMDLAEFQQMESRIKILEKEKEALIESQPQVLVIHKHYDGKIVYGDKAKDKNLMINGFIYNGRYGTPKTPWLTDTYAKEGYNTFDESVSFDSLIANDILKIELIHNNDKTSKDYKNLSEVISEIRNEEELKLKEKLQHQTERANNVEVALETIVQDNEKEIIRLKKTHSEKIEKINSEFAEKIEKTSKDYIEKLEDSEIKRADLQQAFDEFKVDKKRITLEDQISELINKLKEKDAELEKNKNKKLFERIFSK